MSPVTPNGLLCRRTGRLSHLLLVEYFREIQGAQFKESHEFPELKPNDVTQHSQCQLSWQVLVKSDGLMTVGFRLLFTNTGLLLDDAP